MKNINKIIALNCFEIIFAVFFVAISFISWNHLNHGEIKELEEYARQNPSYAYVDVKNSSQYYMYPMSDEEALSRLVPYQVKMVNDTYLKTNYTLGIRIRKTSTLNYQNLKIWIAGNISYLKNYYISEDEEYYYFELEEGVLTAESKNYDIKIWIDSNLKENVSNQTISFEFVNLANIL